MKNDLTWRLEDIAHSLQVEVRGDRLYGLDEWSTPIVNLNSAINAANKLVAERDSALEALRAINSFIYAKGAPLGSDTYFNIRELCVVEIKRAEDAK
jgi:hypothetical protein